MQSTNPQTHKSDSTVFKIEQKLGQFVYVYNLYSNAKRANFKNVIFKVIKWDLLWSIFNQLWQLQLVCGRRAASGVLVFAHVKPQANTPRQGTNWPWKQEKQSETPSLAKNYFLNRTLFSSSVFHICYNHTKQSSFFYPLCLKIGQKDDWSSDNWSFDNWSYWQLVFRQLVFWQLVF